VQLADIAALSPEIILLPDEPYPFADRHRGDLPELADTPAARSGEIHLLDGKALSWYGPRTPAALRQLAAILATVRDG
jgi:ABC-type hemin transport system substrate-binding protein